jgi:hypothetical protein
MTELDETTTTPRPTTGDSLFSAAEPDDEHNARLAVPTAAEWTHYADGFALAGAVLRDHVLAVSRSDLDQLVYPIVYCYRHAVELKLKELLVDAHNTGAAPSAPALNHNLLQLWLAARNVIETTWPKLDEAVLDATGALINELHLFDPGSYDFRYPIDRTHAPSRPRAIGLMNVRHFAEVVGKLLRLLDDAIEVLANECAPGGERA